MKKLNFYANCVLLNVVCAIVLAIACGLMSAGTVKNAVYAVEGGVYYHQHGDCAVKEKSHDHGRKIKLMSREAAEGKLYLCCPKCGK